MHHRCSEIVRASASPADNSEFKTSTVSSTCLWLPEPRHWRLLSLHDARTCKNLPAKGSHTRKRSTSYLFLLVFACSSFIHYIPYLKFRAFCRQGVSCSAASLASVMQVYVSKPRVPSQGFPAKKKKHFIASHVSSCSSTHESNSRSSPTERSQSALLNQLQSVPSACA